MAIIEALDRTPASVTGSSPAVSPENFIKCMRKFYRHWKEDETEIWGSSCAIAVATPPPSEDIRYQKSLALSTWFFGHQFLETIMVFLSRQIHFLCSQKDSDVLKPSKMLVSKEAGVDIVLHILKKGDDGSALMDEIIRAVCAHSESNNVVIGHLAREKPEGKFLEPKVLTSFISKADSDAFYLFDEENAGLPAVKQAPKANVMVPVKPVKQLQSEILKKKTSEAAVRSDVADHKLLEGLGRSRAMDELVAYKNANDVPVSNRLDIIQVDKQNEAILLPIYGVTVPFHVCTIKKAEIRGESSSGVYVSITFNVPGTASGLQDPRLQNLIFLKAVTFLSKNRSHAEEVIKSVKTVQKGVTERARRASLVSQERLQLCDGMSRDRIQFPDLWIRPSFGGRGRKVAGTLVAHVNGFQYSASKTEKVDIMFSNIKHAFFQPAERDMITLLHFHLYNEIMVGNKKTRDVQFYTEVMDVVDAVGLKRHSARDPDEIEEEQRDRARRKKINGQFELFVKRVVSVWSQPRFQQLGLHFERPSQKLGFNGVHGRTTCFIVPTPSCLVQLVESPFLVTSLREVEIVCLERVALGQKSFDMVFVFQDLKRDVVRIEVIPMASLDKIKDWLNDSNLKYYESKLNLNWRMVLKKLDEPGCDTNDRWEFLNPDATDSDSEDSETDDDKYEPSEAESA
uniref:FACT complex subunit n=1 Tax=Aegilops tauschii subsp. strangulata TaxID=200361 RepID=A0A453R6E8_AEGTS